MRLAATSCAIAIAIAIMLPSVDARADNAPPPDPCCSNRVLPTPEETSFSLLYANPRHHEWTLAATADGTFGGGPLFASGSLVTSYAYAVLDQRLHFGARLGFAGGLFGDSDHGIATLLVGARVAADVVRMIVGAVDVFAFAQDDFLLLAKDGGAMMRPALGLGLRAGRLVSFELAYQPVVALGTAFNNGEHARWGGMSFGVSIDLCSAAVDCSSKPHTLKANDLTTVLYKQADAVGKPADPTAFCAAVDEAVRGTGHGPEGAEDAIVRFLHEVAGKVSGDATAKKGLADLEVTHRQLRARLLENRAAVIQASQRDSNAEQACSYQPFVADLRVHLKCAEK